MTKLIYLALVVLQLADVATTYYIIRTKIGHEANPIMAWLMNKLGLVAGLLLPKAVLATVLYALVQLRGIPIWALLVALALYVWVIFNNAGVIRTGAGHVPA